MVLTDNQGNRSRKLQLKNNNLTSPLSEGQTHTFNLRNRSLESPLDMNNLNRISFALEDPRDKWFLEKISISTHSVKYTAPVESWINSNSINKTYNLSATGNSLNRQIDRKNKIYQVSVVTSNSKDAGTDANVTLNLFGEFGDSSARALEQKWRDLFEKGRTDNFELEILDLGKLKKAVLAHDNARFNADWLCDRVEVKDTVTGEVTVFPCMQWIGKKKASTLQRELFPRDG